MIKEQYTTAIQWNGVFRWVPPPAPAGVFVAPGRGGITWHTLSNGTYAQWADVCRLVLQMNAMRGLTETLP